MRFKNLFFSLLLFSFVFSQEISPNLTLKSIRGQNIKLKEYLSKGPILINFWATWCAPCIKEMVYLEEFENKYKNNGFSVISISVDSQKSFSQVRSYIKTKKYTFDVFLDPNMQIFKKLNGNLMPTNILVDRNGKIIWRHYGYLPGDEKKMEEQIVDALNTLP